MPEEQNDLDDVEVITPKDDAAKQPLSAGKVKESSQPTISIPSKKELLKNGPAGSVTSQ